MVNQVEEGLLEVAEMSSRQDTGTVDQVEVHHAEVDDVPVPDHHRNTGYDQVVDDHQ